MRIHGSRSARVAPISTCPRSEVRSTVQIELTELTIRLPTATPQAYLAWVTWWREVEQLLGPDLAMASGDDDGRAPDRGARSIVLQHVRLLEEQAKQASEEGKETISPELSAEPAEWDQWLDYWRTRREWLEALALRELPEPMVPEDLVTLWERTLQMIGVELAIDVAHLHNLKVVGTGTSGSFSLRVPSGAAAVNFSKRFSTKRNADSGSRSSKISIDAAISLAVAPSLSSDKSIRPFRMSLALSLSITGILLIMLSFKAS